MSKLRDLEADRHFLDCLCEHADAVTHLWEIADAALDEIERLKRLLVIKNWEGKWDTLLPCDNHLYPDEDSAWREVRMAAVRKAAIGK